MELLVLSVILWLSFKEEPKPPTAVWPVTVCTLVVEGKCRRYETFDKPPRWETWNG